MGTRNKKSSPHSKERAHEERGASINIWGAHEERVFKIVCLEGVKGKKGRFKMRSQDHWGLTQNLASSLHIGLL